LQSAFNLRTILFQVIVDFHEALELLRSSFGQTAYWFGSRKGTVNVIQPHEQVLDVGSESLRFS
jgi:hypothetical protein